MSTSSIELKAAAEEEDTAEVAAAGVTPGPLVLIPAMAGGGALGSVEFRALGGKNPKQLGSGLGAPRLDGGDRRGGVGGSVAARYACSWSSAPSLPSPSHSEPIISLNGSMMWTSLHMFQKYVRSACMVRSQT